MSFFDGFELVLSYLDTYRNNVIFILVAERCVEVLVCMCFKVLKTLKIGCTEKPHLLKLGSIIYGTDESELILQPHFHFRY
ncbi:hypothetical protein B1146_16745 [Enterococcus faecium]|nr:hypothetical protein B1146_16745 [Enterococcus faecium]